MWNKAQALSAGGVNTGCPERATPPGPALPPQLQSLALMRHPDRSTLRWHRRYGDVWKVRTGMRGRDLVLLADPAHIRQVFAADPAKVHGGHANAIFAPLMGEGSLMLMEAGEHQRTRQLLLRQLTGAALDAHRAAITETVAGHVARWPVGQPVSLVERVERLCLDVILGVVFGDHETARLAPLRTHVEALSRVTPTVLAGWFFPALQRVGPWRRYLNTRDRYDALLRTEIGARRAAGATGRYLLDGLLSHREAGAGLSDRTVRDHVTTLVLAGYSATSAALVWSLYELALRPPVLRRAQRAADERDDEYLDAVVKETLRVRPLIPHVTRRLVEPMEIAGYELAAGTEIAPSIAAVQHNAVHHPDPERFRPGRFAGGSPAVNSWIPFGGGARRCVGAQYSMLEATTFLAEVLRRYDVSPAACRREPARRHGIAFMPGRGGRVVLARHR
ncbi:cytochrome P450 [Amycolatopsis minnesotensis]|uniref:Cytochrome P450 n=1 Tax=Amycolatopsis minnesotensis TaxID=337894 RepID=A0ABN2QCQ4_9PSEU